MEKLKLFFENVWTKYLLLLLITVGLGFLVNSFLFFPIPTLAHEDAWLGFFGSVIGAGIAGIVTLWGIEYAFKSTMMNVKPSIRPVRKNFFLYDVKGNGIIVIDRSLEALKDEYSKKQKVYFHETDKMDYMGMKLKLIEEYKDTKWEPIFDAIDIDELFKRVKEICAFKTYHESIFALSIELPKLYEKGIGDKLSENISDIFHHNIEFETMCEAREQWYKYYSIYNTGAGNAIDIKIQWDFEKKHHMELCKKLGFDQEDYDAMNHSFSLDKVEVAEVDVLSNSNDNNKINAPLPVEVILFIEHLYKKSLRNSKERKYENNNAVIYEHQIAEIKAIYEDIHGKGHSNKYKVIIKINSSIPNHDRYTEVRIFMKFENTKD